MVVVLFVVAVLCVESRETLKRTKGKQVVAIDPGHGGFDPGKVGVTGVLEKDINLAISFKVRKKLEKKGVQVIMTRTTDDAICSPEEKNKKMADMRNRVEIINASNAAIAVSIHQNSFTDSSFQGSTGLLLYRFKRRGSTGKDFADQSKGKNWR